MRRREGTSLGQILTLRVDEIEALAKQAEAAPGRKPEAIKARLADQIATLLETSDEDPWLNAVVIRAGGPGADAIEQLLRPGSAG